MILSPYLTLAFGKSSGYLNIDFSVSWFVQLFIHSFIGHLLCNRHHTQMGNTDVNEEDSSCFHGSYSPLGNKGNCIRVR